MKRERDIWRTLQHENVLPLCGVCELASALASMPMCMFVSPFMRQGSLLEYLRRNAFADRLRLVGSSRDHCRTTLTHTYPR